MSETFEDFIAAQPVRDTPDPARFTADNAHSWLSSPYAPAVTPIQDTTKASEIRRIFG